MRMYPCVLLQVESIFRLSPYKRSFLTSYNTVTSWIHSDTVIRSDNKFRANFLWIFLKTFRSQESKFALKNQFSVLFTFLKWSLLNNSGVFWYPRPQGFQKYICTYILLKNFCLSASRKSLWQSFESSESDLNSSAEKTDKSQIARNEVVLPDSNLNELVL